MENNLRKTKKIRKTKECPSCNKKGLGQKVRKCPKCAHQFVFERKIIGPSKRCPNCNTELKKRARICYKCRFEFLKVKKNGEYERIKNWRGLKEGSIIYLKKGSRGPYFPTENDKILMASRGKFVVGQVRDNGLTVYSRMGMEFLYMGREYTCDVTGLVKRPYRIFKKK